MPDLWRAEVFEHLKGDSVIALPAGKTHCRSPLTDVDAVVDVIFRASHRQLLDSPEARRYLLHERRLHPQVVLIQRLA